jgi:hypothetical protein
MASRIVLLIHGVGDSEAGVIRQAARKVLDDSELANVQTEEFHWNTIVEKPAGKWSGIALRYFNSLLRGIVCSALEGVDTRRSWLPTAVFVLSSLAPLFVGWLGSIRVLHLAQTLPREWQPVLPVLLLPMAPSLIIGRFAVAHSEPLLIFLFRAWFAILCGSALLHVFWRALHGSAQMAAAIRTVVLAFAWQFVVLAGLASMLLGFSIVTAPVTLWVLLYNFSLVPHSTHDSTVYIPSFTDLFANLPHVLGSILIGAAILICVLFLIWFALEPVLKVLADIFRYLGDPEYRTMIQSDLDRCFGTLDLVGKELFLVGHSLGSVIVVDALWRGANHLARCSSITLITLGSPLRRFFWRFFRSAIPRPDELEAGFHIRYQSFRWINTYRPFDPFGTKLFDVPGRDFSTRQYHRVLAWAHTNYWSDRNVLGRVRRALTRPPADAVPASNIPEISLFQDVGLQQFPAAARNRMVALWVILPVVAFFASRLYFNIHFEIAEYAVKTAKIDKNSGESSGRVWGRPYKTITNSGFPTEYTEYLISYNAAGCEYSFVIERDLAETLKEARHGPLKVRYLRNDPAEYYLLEYDQPAWPSDEGWVLRIIILGFISVFLARGLVGVGQFLASLALGTYRPHVADRTSRPAADPIPATALKRKRKIVFAAIAGAVLAVIAGYEAWTRIVIPSPAYQLRTIRSELNDCLKARGPCSDPGWIPLLARLGERDQALATAREVAKGERVWVLNELKKVGVPIPYEEYEDVLASAALSDRDEDDHGIRTLAMIAKHLSAVGKTDLAEKALREASKRFEAFRPSPYVALQYASDAGLSDLAASVWDDALRIVATDVPPTTSSSGNDNDIEIALGADVLAFRPRPSSGRVSPAIRAQYIFDKIPRTADLAPVLKLVDSWPVTYERVGAVACLAVGLLGASRDDEAFRLLQTVPEYWEQRTQPLPRVIPTGDAFRLTTDIADLFRHFSEHGQTARLQGIINHLPPGSDIRTAAEHAMPEARAKAESVPEPTCGNQPSPKKESEEAMIDRAQALLKARSYEEAHIIAETSNGAAHWTILGMMLSQLQSGH